MPLGGQPAQTAADLRYRAWRLRAIAREFPHDDVAAKLRALADELDARAGVMEEAAVPAEPPPD